MDEVGELASSVFQDTAQPQSCQDVGDPLREEHQGAGHSQVGENQVCRLCFMASVSQEAVNGKEKAIVQDSSPHLGQKADLRDQVAGGRCGCGSGLKCGGRLNILE